MRGFFIGQTLIIKQVLSGSEPTSLRAVRDIQYHLFYRKDFHLSLNLSNFWFLIAIYFSVITSWLITDKILDSDICFGLSI
jgi:hypothetical protein